VDVVNNRLLYVSPSTRKVCNLDIEMPIPCLGWIVPEDRETVRLAWQQALLGEQVEVESRVHAPGENVRWFRCVFQPFRDASGQVVRIDGLMEDATDAKLTIERLTDAGYMYIGMDHFARADDELAIAQRNGTLHRNFQGYSTHAECDLIGLGVTAISALGDSYSQNQRTLEGYSQALDAGLLATLRGIELDADDRLRRDVIAQLICRGRLDIPEIEKKHAIRFATYFAREMEDLKGMRDDGLVTIGPEYIQARPLGKLLIRNICMFDRYLRQPAQQQRYSRAI